MSTVTTIKRALISVSDKSGLLELGKALHEKGVELISTGGTARVLEQAGLPVTKVSSLTNFPEMMGGRVKSLHPAIHGGLLMRRDNGSHSDEKEAAENGIKPIDLVVVNLYPFEETVAKDVTRQQAIEQIDIGGPSMLRSAAKNHEFVSVLCDPSDYSEFIETLNHNEITLELRQKWALKVFQKTAAYDAAIASYLQKNSGENGLRNTASLDLHYNKVMDLRYGENPHQEASFYSEKNFAGTSLADAKVLQGKPLSYNNLIDANAALGIVMDFVRPTASVIKHTNPCGVASAASIEDAFTLAYQVDPMSAFGCVIALNRPCTLDIANYISKNKLFVEIIIAPSFTEQALEKLSSRKKLRLLEVGELQFDPNQKNIRSVMGGLLVQDDDQKVVNEEDLNVVTEKSPNSEEMEAMLFARRVVKHVKSNAVVFAKIHDKGGAVATGIGAGQMSRVDSVIIARRKGGDRIPGSVLASDAFFPFPDGVEEAHAAGVTAIIQPGGSIRDEEVTKKANQLGLSMVHTGVRSFKH